jgi:hypothetical protein
MSCFWLVTAGEPIPGDVHRARLLRTGLFGRALARRGHEVHWITNRFDHFAKAHRPGAADQSSEGIVLHLLESRGYRSNVSLARALDHTQLSRAFVRRVKTLPRPDAIVAALPTVGLAAAAMRHAERIGVPGIVDVRDMWPDVFFDLLPRALRPLAEVALFPMRMAVRGAMQSATAIWGHAPAFVEWGVAYAARGARPADRVFPHGYELPTIAEPDRRKAVLWWRERGVDLSTSIKIAAYVGTISRQCDFDEVLRAADMLADSGVLFVLCGSGDSLAGLQRAAGERPNLVVPGWCGSPEVGVLLERACIGLMPYRRRDNFLRSIPNKAIEYMAYDVPIAWSLEDTELSTFISDHGVGRCYDSSSTQLAELVMEVCRANTEGTAGKRGREVFEAHFSAARVYCDMAEALEALAAAGRRV